MIEAKRFSGRMNKDDSYYVLPPEDYVDAQNITHDAVEESHDSIISNIVANRLVENNIFYKFYIGTSYNLFTISYDNGNNTQTVITTFGTIPNISAMVLSYFMGGIWVDFPSGADVSPKTAIIPSGDFPLRITVTTTDPSTIIYPLTETTSRYVCIGAYANTLRNTIVFMVWNENNYDLILEYNNSTRTITSILKNLVETNNIDILGFTEDGKISSINIYNRDEGDLLFFIDSLLRPTFMNIARMKAGEYIPIENRFILDTAKRQPLVPPSSVYGDDATRRVNYLMNRFFRFRYRYVYDDDFKSTYSPISEVLVPVGILDLTIVNNPTKNNIITLSIYSGDQDVKAIEICMSYAQKSDIWIDFATVVTINKLDDSIADNVLFSYVFNNDSTYPTVIETENDLPYDWIPLEANCQELINGNVLGFGGITEGYNKDTEMDVSVSVSQYEVSTSTTGSLTAVTNIVIDNGSQQTFTETFSGIPAVGTTIEIKVQQVSGGGIHTAATYTTIAGDTPSSVAIAIANSATSLNQVFAATASGSLVYFIANALLQPKRIFYSIEIVSPSSSAASNSIPSWKWSTERNIGIAYFDQCGRTNGILYNTKVTFPAYADDISGATLLPYILASISNRPPLWAYSYQFLFTKENTYSLFWTSNDVNTDETNYIYFDVTGFVANATQFPTTTSVLSYSFQDGDRLRLIKPLGTNTYFTDTFDTQLLGYLDAPTINNIAQTGKRFLKINKVLPFQNSTFIQDNYVIEIYRPQQQLANDTNQTYYECSLQYDILNPATAERCHAGMLQDQTSNLSQPATFEFKKGDWYFRIRSIALTESGSATFNVMDRNIVDTYISAVNSIDGRPNLIDINAKQAYYGATIRHGQAYQPNTNVNGLNRFYPQDFIDVDYSYGDIERIKTRDRLLRVFQTLKIGRIPLFSKIAKSPTGDEVTITTTSLLNPVQYYIGDWGIGTARESLASFNFADYVCDNIKGAIIRLSNNGNEPLSILYKMNSWANNELPLRKNTYKIYGCFEQRQNNYTIAIEETPTSEPQTLTWDEERNSFDSFVSYHPEMMCQLGVLFVTFKDGQLWTHDDEPFYNNFYGTQYNSSVTGIFNKNVLEKKTYQAIAEVSNQVWACPEIETTLNSYRAVKQQSNLIEDDFVELESDFNAPFLRDSNSIGGIINGDALKGNWIKIKFQASSQLPPSNNILTLSVVSCYYNDSPLNKIQ